MLIYCIKLMTVDGTTLPAFGSIPGFTEENLHGFMKKLERDKWLAAASRHYDKTGQRISMATAKKMYGNVEQK